MPSAPLSAQQQSSLAERIRKGDQAAEDELVRLFSDRVLVMMRARTRDPEAAHELAQDVMVAVLRALRNGQVREPERLAAFVYGTARNLVSNYLRARSQHPKEEPISSELAAANPAENVETSERVVLVRRALECLDSRDRKILLLTLVEGLKPGEIAAHLGLNPVLVRQRKSRAVKKVIERIRKMSRK